MDITAKVALVTGAASGLGAQTARCLAAVGVSVVLLDAAHESVQKLAKEISGLAFTVDVTDEAQMIDILSQVVAKYGAIHICVNCAGIAKGVRIVGREGPMPLTDFRHVVDVNLMGTFNVLRLVAAQMQQQDPVNNDGERGVIINTASIAAEEGQIGQAAYSASKAGVAALTLPAARELGQWGIRVVSIAPGIFNTPMMQAMPEPVRESLAANIPFPSRLGHADEFAELVLHIINNAYLNACVLRLDGGLRMAEK